MLKCNRINWSGITYRKHAKVLKDLFRKWARINHCAWPIIVNYSGTRCFSSIYIGNSTKTLKQDRVEEQQRIKWKKKHTNTIDFRLCICSVNETMFSSNSIRRLIERQVVFKLDVCCFFFKFLPFLLQKNRAVCKWNGDFKRKDSHLNSLIYLRTIFVIVAAIRLI